MSIKKVLLALKFVRLAILQAGSHTQTIPTATPENTAAIASNCHITLGSKWGT